MGDLGETEARVVVVEEGGGGGCCDGGGEAGGAGAEEGDLVAGGHGFVVVVVVVVGVLGRVGRGRDEGLWRGELYMNVPGLRHARYSLAGGAARGLCQVPRIGIGASNVDVCSIHDFQIP